MEGRTNATRNEFDQAVGFEVPDWTQRPRPPRATMVGRTCRLEALDVEQHGADLERVFVEESAPAQWTYLPYGPFTTRPDLRAWLEAQAPLEDPLYHAIVEQETGRASGLAAYLRIAPEHGVIEVGHIHYSPRLQRSVPATEAMFLLMRRAFELGYRRYEWKCDSLNAPSIAAARRLGFQFEGVFRQNIVYKGRNRDTSWFSITDGEWPRLEKGFERWLATDNFDTRGRQKRRLQELFSPTR